MLIGFSAMRARKSARAMLLDEDNRMLWLHVEDNISEDAEAKPTAFWCTPGGGLEPGENFEEALRREMLEELGLRLSEAGLHIATDMRTLPWRGKWISNDSRLYLFRVGSPQVGFANLTDQEKEVFCTVQWWSYEEIHASGELFLPKAIVELFGEIAGGSGTVKSGRLANLGGYKCRPGQARGLHTAV